MKLYVAAVALVGCAQSSSVQGHYQYRYMDGTTVPIDLTHVQFQVLVENGDGYDHYPEYSVAGTVDGTFEIPDVPDGPFLLMDVSPGGFPYVGRPSTRDIESTRDMLGRPDDVQVTAATPLTIDATNLSPWGTNDGLYIDCLENATEASTPTFTPALATGASAIDGSFDWDDTQHVYAYGKTRLPYLMRAGDHVTISHETDLQTTPIATFALTQVLTADAPAQVNGQPATVTGAFVDVARTEQLSITVDPAPLVAQGNPPARWSVNAIAGPLTNEGYYLGPDLFGTFQAAPIQAATTSVTYGNPFDATSTPWLYADFGADWKVSELFTEPVNLAHEDRPLASGSFTFEPLPAPTDVTMDGNAVGNTFRVTPGVSLPLDADVPDGTKVINVTVMHVDQAGFPAVAGNVVTDRMPVALPAEMFQSGEKYAFEITAWQYDGDVTRSSTATTDVMTYIAQ